MGDEYYVCGAEEGVADYGTRGRYDPPKLWFPLFLLRVVVVCCARARADGGRHERGELSEDKTQRRPHSARESERGGFPLLFRCFCIFLSAGQEETPRDDYEKRR